MGKKLIFLCSKNEQKQAKDSQISAGSYVSKKLPRNIKNVLLIDDLFGEGNTANYTVSALKRKNPNIFIRFISLTKNKYGGIPKKYKCRISKYSKSSVNNESQSIDLYFYRDDKPEHVKIWEEHHLFGVVKQAFEKKRFYKSF